MIGCHVAPDRDDLERNAVAQPEGERIRRELEEFITQNKIVGLMIDTQEHSVRIDMGKLPNRIKCVLSIWGSIYVRDDAEPKGGQP